MSRQHLYFAVVSLLLSQSVLAVCTFDQSGTISNPQDPACRDTQFVYTENDNSGNNVALGYPPPMPVNSLTAVDGFRTYDALFARHQDLMLTTASVDGSVVGQTAKGRDIWAYQFGDSDNLTWDGRPEGAVIVSGGIHAREWQSPEVLTEIFEQLVERSTDNNIGQFLHDNLNVVLVPVLNVDGFIQTQNFPARFTADINQPRDGRMRRKNMRLTSGGTIDENLDTTDDSFFGIDLNRNSVHGWGQNNASSNNVVSLVYRGPNPSTEPEIQALIAATQLGPADRLRLGIDMHSFTAIYFTPMTGNTRRDAITTSLATRMRAVTDFKYRYGPGPVGSPGIGSTDNYYAFEFQIPAYTLELEPLNGGQDYGGTGVSHSGFVVPDNEIARIRDEIADTLLLGFFHQSDPPHVVAAQIRHNSDDSLIYAAQWQVTGNTRQLAVATSKALVPGTEYKLWVAFSKPMRWLDPSGQLTSFAGQANPDPAIVISSADAGATFSTEIEIPASAWRSTAGGAPDGYLRYSGDALSAVFTLPASIAPASPTAASLQVEISDIAENSLDADPATIADWSDGHWVNYENSGETDSDSGGADCKLVSFVATDAAAAAPNQATTCPAKQAATPAPLPTPTPTPPPSGGGGGNGLWLLPLVYLLYRRQ